MVFISRATSQIKIKLKGLFASIIMITDEDDNFIGEES